MTPVCAWSFSPVLCHTQTDERERERERGRETDTDTDTHTQTYVHTVTHTHAHTRTHTHTHAHTLPRAPHGAGGRPSASALLGHSFFGGVRDVEQEVTCPPFDPGFEAGGISINDVHAHLHSIIEQDFQ